MPNIQKISNLGMKELDVYLQLTEAQLRNKRNRERGMMVAEGIHTIEAAMQAGCRPISFLMEEKHITGKAAGILAGNDEVPVYTAERETLQMLTGYELTRGVLCAMYRPVEKTLREVCRAAKKVAVLEGLADPTNIGAVFRSAAALNMDAVLLTPTCADPYHRRALRVSMGSVFRLPWARFQEWPARGMSVLRENGFHISAMAISDKGIPLQNTEFERYERNAVLLGSEGDGLKQETIALCDDVVYIPMANGVDSLNVAAAGAIAFWQLGTCTVPSGSGSGEEP